MSVHRRLERLEVRVVPEPSRKSSEARARMKASLDEFAAAKREGRAPSAEAEAVAEAILERRRHHES
jgi:hypothetical protein